MIRAWRKSVAAEVKDVTAVVFDMDGVLYDTESISMQSWREAGKQMSVPDVGQTVLDCMGMNRKGMFEYFYVKYGPDFPVEAFLDRTRALSVEAIRRNGLPVMKGAKEVLAFLNHQGYPLALASSTRQKTVLAHLEETGMRHFFRAVVCGDMVENSKPAPDIYELACKRLGTEPAKTVAVEDSFNGIRSAHAAGMLPLMVPDMMAPTPEIEALLWKKCTSLFEVIRLFGGKV